MSIFSKIRLTFGLGPSERDKMLKELIKNTYESTRVVGRGTVHIDPKEVITSEEFKDARRKAKDIVNA